MAGSSAADWIAVAVAAVAAGSAAVTAVLVARMQARQEYRSALHAARLKAYQELFSILRPFALDGRSPPIDQQVKENVADKITEWYFKAGGVVLTAPMRDEVLDFRAELLGIDRGHRRQMEDQLREAEPIRATASALRTALTREVMSRDEPGSS
jgi:hypothetical protein